MVTLRVLVGLAGALTIYVVGAALLRKFKIEPEPEPDPAQLRPVDVEFRCTICGTTVVMTAPPATSPSRPATAGRTWSGSRAAEGPEPDIFPRVLHRLWENSVGSYTSGIPPPGATTGAGSTGSRRP